jgi:alpha-tubulin suppressor-like RCC1 family protein
MLAIQSDNTLWSWGGNSYGQNGRGVSGAGVQSPAQVGSLSLWTKISTGYYNSYGIQSDGLLWAWGSNSFGQTGINSTIDAKNPSNVSGTWKEISAGQWHAAGIQSNGTLWAWGMNSVRLIVSGDITQRFTPVQIGSNSDWVQVSCGDGTIFAQRSDGSRYSWGLNDFGQLGRLPNFSYSPVQIGSLSNWTNAICGTNFVIAQRSDSTLWAWGNNSYGQYGNNSRSAGFSSPVQAGNSTSDWKNIAVGDYFTAGIKNDNTLWTWGNNTCGQLGLSDVTDRSSVVQVGSDRNYKNIYAMPNALLINLY